MLNQWLKVAYQEDTKKQDEHELMNLLENLPVEDLRKLADGSKIAELYPHLDKIAHGDDDVSCWLDKFKGSPLFEQAIALESENLQLDMAEQQKREQRRASRSEDSMDSVYDAKDKIRLKKKMLELELVKQEAGTTAPAQGAGAPGDVPPEGVQDSSSGLGGGVAKAAQAKFEFADYMGRELARADMQKAASIQFLTDFGNKAGVLMAKEALNLGALAPAAQKALSFVGKNPAAVGAGLGAVGGAVAGGPNHRLSGALGGAALGGTAGHLGAGAIEQGAGKLQKALPVGSGFSAPAAGTPSRTMLGSAPKAPGA